jgi:hypothetical protein
LNFKKFIKMLNIPRLFFVASLATLTGCATIPSDAQNQASKDLQGACFAMFSYGRFQGDQPAGLYAGREGYQYWGESLRIKAFAIGYKPNNQQVCAYSTIGKLVENNSQERIVNNAINTCNNQGADNCVVYATGDYNIIYNRELHAIKIDQQNKMRAEVDKNRRLQAEVEEKKRLEMHQAAQRERESSNNSNQTLVEAKPTLKNEVNDKISLDTAKKKCAELGFKQATEGFGKCVLQLSR